MPTTFIYGGYIQYQEGSFLLFGGYGNDGTLGQDFNLYHHTNESWDVLPRKMEMGSGKTWVQDLPINL
jgi:hypothetical protein